MMRLLCVVIVWNRNHSAKRKDAMVIGTGLNRVGRQAGMGPRGSIDSSRFPVHKRAAAQPAQGKDFHPKFTLCRA
jgi:hypothetical protein